MLAGSPLEVPQCAWADIADTSGAFRSLVERSQILEGQQQEAHLLALILDISGAGRWAFLLREDDILLPREVR